MKIFGSVALVLFFAVAGWSQAGKADCPQITVSGPAGTATPKDQLPFTLRIMGEPTGDGLQISWATENGKIVAGPDPRQIKVADWDYYKNVTVRAEVKGLPPGCPSSAAETFGMSIEAPARLVDDYGPAAFEEVKEYLLNSAARDFHDHQPPYPSRFRNVRIGHLGDPAKTGYYRLCGEFMPSDGGAKAEWTRFATVKTSGYEQYLGTTAYCTDKRIRWDTKGDLASVLKGKLDLLKNAQ
jgi:hypothetical protein